MIHLRYVQRPDRVLVTVKAKEAENEIRARLGVPEEWPMEFYLPKEPARELIPVRS